MSRQDEIVSELRRRITSGQLPPESRCPTVKELCHEFKASPPTIQKALDILKRQEFVHTKGRAGTFVTKTPPHLCRYALVVPPSGFPELFFRAIQAAVQARLKLSPSMTITHYLTPQDGPHVDFRRLEKEVLSHQVAGLIFLNPPFGAMNSPVVTHPGIPRVGIMAASSQLFPVVDADFETFLGKAAGYLRSRGRTRTAHLYLDAPHTEPMEMERRLDQAGMTYKPFWIQSVPNSDNLYRSARRIVQLLMHLKDDDRPDSLIIHDDHLVEQAINGILAAGVHSPSQLEVVAHANFPHFFSPAFPITRLGFDCRAIIDRCLEILAMQRDGLTPPPITCVPAVFEHDLPV